MIGYAHAQLDYLLLLALSALVLAMALQPHSVAAIYAGTRNNLHTSMRCIALWVRHP